MKEINIDNFLDAEGKIKNFPAKQSAKMLVLRYLADKFEPGRRYSEKEVGAIVDRWHTFGDYFLLRRELCERGFMGRERNGSAYWLEENQPEL